MSHHIVVKMECSCVNVGQGGNHGWETGENKDVLRWPANIENIWGMWSNNCKKIHYMWKVFDLQDYIQTSKCVSWPNGLKTLKFLIFMWSRFHWCMCVEGPVTTMAGGSMYLSAQTHACVLTVRFVSRLGSPAVTCFSHFWNNGVCWDGCLI